MGVLKWGTTMNTGTHRDRLLVIIENVERLRESTFAPVKSASDVLLKRRAKEILSEIKTSRLETNKAISYLYRSLAAEIGEEGIKELLHQHTHIFEAVGLKKLFDARQG